LAIQVVALREYNNEITHVYPGGINIPLKNMESIFTKYEDILAKIPEKERDNLYFTLGHHTGVEDALRPVRQQGTFEYQELFPFDIDHVDTSRCLDYAGTRTPDSR